MSEIKIISDRLSRKLRILEAELMVNVLISLEKNRGNPVKVTFADGVERWVYDKDRTFVPRDEIPEGGGSASGASSGDQPSSEAARSASANPKESGAKNSDASMTIEDPLNLDPLDEATKPEETEQEPQKNAAAAVESISTKEGKIDLNLLESEVDKEIQSGQIKLPTHDEIVADVVKEIDFDAEANFFNTDIEELAAPENPAVAAGVQASANKVSDRLKTQAQALSDRILEVGNTATSDQSRLEFYNQAAKTLEANGMEVSPELQRKILQATKEKYLADYKKRVSVVAKSVKKSIAIKSEAYKKVGTKIQGEIDSIKDPNVKKRVQERAEGKAKSSSWHNSLGKDWTEAKKYFSNYDEKVASWKDALGVKDDNLYPAQLAAALFSPAVKLPINLIKDELANSVVVAKFAASVVGSAVALLSHKDEESEKVQQKPTEYIVPKKITQESKKTEKQIGKDTKEANKYKEQIAELEQMLDDMRQTIYFDFAEIESAGSLADLEKRLQGLNAKQDALIQQMNSLFSAEEQKEMNRQKELEEAGLANADSKNSTQIADAGQDVKA